MICVWPPTLNLARARAARFAPDRAAGAMLDRWVAAGDDLSVMLSMRYEGGNVDKPFVDGSIVSRGLQARDVAGLAEMAVETFGAFGAFYLRLWSAEPTGAFGDVGADKRFLAAPIRALRGGPAEGTSEAGSGSRWQPDRPPDLA